MGLHLHEKFSLCCGLKIINLHPKLSPGALRAPQPKHKHTTATILLVLQLTPPNTVTQARTHIHTESLSLFLCCFVLSPPLWQPLLRGREGEERGGREGEGRRGRGARPPCSHGRAECLHCCGSLCNTSGILRPLSPARDGGAVEGRWFGEGRGKGVLGQRETFLAKRE